MSILPDKPRMGEKCNGCGACCASSLCEIGKMVFNEDELPCPALIMKYDLKNNKTSTACSFVVYEMNSDVEPVFQRALGIGLGCSMEDG